MTPYFQDDGVGIEPPQLWQALIVALGIAVLIAICGIAKGDVTGHWFSPNGGAEQAIIEHADSATKEILWQSYNFTSQPFADALKRAKARGVSVIVICDADEARKKWSKAAELSKAGIAVYLDNRHAIAHDKTRIFDGIVVLAGSYNDSDSAEHRNGETLIAFDDADDVAACIANFKKHLGHSKALRIQVSERK